MAVGHFIRLGDKTTCGGTVLEADSRVMMFGIAHAREGDRVSCGKDGKVYKIIGGISYINSHGRVVAGTLDSFSGCPCKARLIPSLFTATYQSRQGNAAATRRSTSHSASPASPASPTATTKLINPQMATDKLLRTACVFTKCSKLPDSVIDYNTSSGTFPVDDVSDYGNLVLLGGREVDDSGKVQLQRISGNVPAGFGSLALRGLAPSGAGESCGGFCEVASAGGAVASGGRVAVGTGSRVVGGGILTGGVVGGSLLGVVAMLWPSSLGDSALYTEEQLRTMKQGRTRVRIRVEQQPDGPLKGYGYNTQLRSDWETIPVVQFSKAGSQMVADFGGGVELIWTPAVDPSDTLGIPALEAAPQTPQITIYPPVEQADNLIVNPIYPPEYRDFILVFPMGSGIAPLYIVMNARHDPGVVTGVGEDVFGIWLAGAGEDVGVPIPTSVANELRGMSFNSFDSFRRAFWKAVSNDPVLTAQFVPQNTTRMTVGKAPRVHKKDRVGGRRSFELHHLDKVSEGGGVYDVDNLRINTPRNHVDLHRGGK
ncbi:MULTISPECIES: S-type pyocin domain-containing protein [unclassified Pseudomonas]|uniref:S-type pyocin domain-containing protein n=1 Tax=unclassified Pseudomonas TaxID=196821 RepID=UPI0007312790|nr:MULTISPECIES: S-type pyocin domain-containing protein [unclassified Pseudomonas]KSW22439.1 colicin-E3 [Pseudomonas sp. ADP]OBP12384.1 colicin-E3 [Pseudomonas sp. EGD-AKN5]QOF85245.1 S-type pyocin domain-containing protein [Pseudomonas sp. ADPe]